MKTGDPVMFIENSITSNDLTFEWYQEISYTKVYFVETVSSEYGIVYINVDGRTWAYPTNKVTTNVTSVAKLLYGAGNE